MAFDSTPVALARLRRAWRGGTLVSAAERSPVDARPPWASRGCAGLLGAGGAPIPLAGSEGAPACSDSDRPGTRGPGGGAGGGREATDRTAAAPSTEGPPVVLCHGGSFVPTCDQCGAVVNDDGVYPWGIATPETFLGYCTKSCLILWVRDHLLEARS